MRFCLSFSLLLLARLAVAQAADTTHRVSGAQVSGIVRDSVARAPLDGAIVQLVSTDSTRPFGATAVSDSAGRFAFADVPDGRFAIGFYHPAVEALGITLPLRTVVVRGARAVRVDLAIPSPAVISAAICSAPAAPRSMPLLLGTVRDAATRAPIAGAKVVSEWAEITLGPNRIDHSRPRVVVTSSESGWFAICGVPSPGVLALSATHEADSTDVIEVEMPRDGFLRRELFLGPARTIAIGDTSRRADSSAPPPPRMHIGDGKLRGKILAEASGRPLTGAIVRVSDGPGARTNDYGEWAVMNAPAGTRMIEMRAVGYYPVRQAVDVVDGAAPMHVALATLRAVLDTVRIFATFRDRDGGSGFIERRRSAMGHFYATEDIARLNPFVTSDLFKSMPMVRTERDSMGVEQFVMRGIFTRECTPEVYINGARMIAFGPDEVDGMIPPKALAGVEVYAPGTVPLQFQVAMQECGSIVFWTK